MNRLAHFAHEAHVQQSNLCFCLFFTPLNADIIELYVVMTVAQPVDFLQDRADFLPDDKYVLLRDPSTPEELR